MAEMGSATLSRESQPCPAHSPLGGAVSALRQPVSASGSGPATVGFRQRRGRSISRREDFAKPSDRVPYWRLCEIRTQLRDP
jgi:hypothetical protein